MAIIPPKKSSNGGRFDGGDTVGPGTNQQPDYFPPEWVNGTGKAGDKNDPRGDKPKANMTLTERPKLKTPKSAQMHPDIKPVPLSRGLHSVELGG